MYGPLAAVLRGPVLALLCCCSFVIARFIGGNPLSNDGGDLVYIHHLARLQIAQRWHEWLSGSLSLRQFAQQIDGDFPPLLHLATLFMGTLIGHSAEAAVLSGLLWLSLLAGSVGYISTKLSRNALAHRAPGSRADRAAGSLAATVVLLMGALQGFSLKYYYDLPMTALLWFALATLLWGWQHRPVVAGCLSGILATCAALTKWTALPFATAMALGLALYAQSGANSPSQARRRRLSMAIACGVVLLTSGGFLLLVHAGQAESSLSVMSGTFQSRAGAVLDKDHLLAKIRTKQQNPDPFRLAWSSPEMGDSEGLWINQNNETGEQEIWVLDADRTARIYRRSPRARGYRLPLYLHRKQEVDAAASRPAQANGAHTASGDIDGDGDVDQVQLTEAGQLNLLRNDGGQLKPQTSWRPPVAGSISALALGDSDADNDLDLAVAVRGDSNLLYRYQNGLFELAWKSAQKDQSANLAWGDWDNDGDLDLAVANLGSEPNRIYENGAGSLLLAWTSQAANSSTKVVWGDWDNDGDADPAFSNLDGPTRVYRAEGGGPSLAWESPAVDPSSDLLWTDWNSDGALDLMVANQGRNPERLFLGSPLRADEAISAAAPTPAPGPIRDTAQVAESATFQRLSFYPYWLVHSLFSLPVASILLALSLWWALRSRVGLSLLLSTVIGQWLFLMLAVPPLDVRFVVSMAPCLIIAAVLGWGMLARPLRKPVAGVLTFTSLLVAFDFHFLSSNPANSERSLLQPYRLTSSSYPDGGWKRGELERQSIATGKRLSWREDRRFRQGLFASLKRCSAQTVIIASDEGPIDDMDYWKYRMALAWINDENGWRAERTELIRGVDVDDGVQLGSLQGDKVADLALSVVGETAEGSLPPGIRPGTMRATEILRAGPSAPAVQLWRPKTADPCQPP